MSTRGVVAGIRPINDFGSSIVKILPNVLQFWAINELVRGRWGDDRLGQRGSTSRFLV